MQHTRRGDNQSDHKIIRGVAYGEFTPLNVYQMQQVLSGHGLRFGRSAILRIVRRLVRRGKVTAFLDREPPEYMELRDSSPCKDTRPMSSRSRREKTG